MDRRIMKQVLYVLGSDLKTIGDLLMEKDIWELNLEQLAIQIQNISDALYDIQR